MVRGVGTVCLHIVCETTGISPKPYGFMSGPIRPEIPDSGTSTASCQTLLTGEATKERRKTGSRHG